MRGNMSIIHLPPFNSKWEYAHDWFMSFTVDRDGRMRFLSAYKHVFSNRRVER